MRNAIFIGTGFGTIVGMIHAGYIYCRLTRESPANLAKAPIAVRARAAWFALWTLFLWVVFGAYVFYLWLISIVIYAVCRTMNRFMQNREFLSPGGV